MGLHHRLAVLSGNDEWPARLSITPSDLSKKPARSVKQSSAPVMYP